MKKKLIYVVLASAISYFSFGLGGDTDPAAHQKSVVSRTESSTGSYSPDNNPHTFDEDPTNYPLESPRTYINTFQQEVQSPTHYKSIPEGACAICRDGTYSFSKNRRGTCSHHGGVAKWMN